MAQQMTKETALWIYERMCLIRNLEERVVDGLMKGKIPGIAHVYEGEEAIAVGACAQLTDRDYITSTHRGHGHCIAKGVDVKKMVAELYGKATGACKGKGGSMHIADIDKGMLGANGIVGAGGPIACGAALSAKTRGTDQVTVCFFGDGAAEQGTMHEAMNLASILKLPVIFMCENNVYAESTPASYHCSVGDICSRAVAYGMPGVKVDGADAFAVYEATGAAVDRARRGEGPTLIEAKAFRYYGHYVGDPKKYMTQGRDRRIPGQRPHRQVQKAGIAGRPGNRGRAGKTGSAGQGNPRRGSRLRGKLPLANPRRIIERRLLSL